MSEILNQSILTMKNVGTARAESLGNLGVNTIEDLLELYPREYEDRTITKKICELKIGDKVTINASIKGNFNIKYTRTKLTLTTVEIDDGSGTLSLVFYNQNYIRNQLNSGKMYSFFGEVVRGHLGLEMHNAAFEVYQKAESMFKGILPVYPLTKKISQNILRNMVHEILKNVPQIPDLLPLQIIEKYALCSRDFAIRNIHFPIVNKNLEISRYRLVFDELLSLQLALYQTKKNYTLNGEGIKFEQSDNVKMLFKNLPFKLTQSQIKVWHEIESDMESYKIMNRLVQGDVGSGKTIIAILAMVKAISSGYQTAYMAPTEILAHQHLVTVNEMLKPIGLAASLLVGSISAKEKKQVLEGLKDGSITCVIGTHALIQKTVAFKNIGLVITDEQHRFGVRQRAALSAHGTNPDILVMTATPIPRTLALILYGDLDISIIDTLPVGRKMIKTYMVDETTRTRINDWIIKLVNEGRQIYIVHPSIEDGEIENITSATTNYENLSSSVFQNITTGLIHGKMKSDQKDIVMKSFIEGDIKILFSTTVIEVGVNVPNAALMVVENAERFGLAQLHQLRGRVGRGEYQSFCVLYNQSKSEVSAERMEIMTSTCDGFIISEKDLEIRGPGEFFGTRQHGLPILKIANLYQDIEILKLAQEAALIIKNETDDSIYQNYIDYIKSKLVMSFNVI